MTSRLELDGTGLCASFQLRKAARAVTQLYDAGLAASGVRSTQLTILIAVAKSQPSAVGALAALTGMDTTTMTRSLKVLAQGGLLALGARSTGRRRLVTLTPRGERLLRRALPRWRAVHERFIRAVGAREWLALVGALQSLATVATALESPRRGRAQPMPPHVDASRRSR